MDFWKLFIVALIPVLKVLLVTAVGTFVALERFGILMETARKNMNTMVFFVFTPALLCSILAKTMTLSSLVMMWFMPVNVLLTFLIGTALGWLLLKITRVPHHLHGLVLGCCAAGNLGNLPLIIVPAMCKERSNPFGDVNVCYRDGLAYASLSTALGSIYTWSYVYNIVRVYSCKISNLVTADDSTVDAVSAAETDPENLSKCSNGACVTSENRSQTNDHVKQLEIECTMHDEQAKVSTKQKVMKQMRILSEKINLKVLFAPSSVGAIAGLIIGVVPQFRNLFVGERAPLFVVQDSLAMLGDAAIPAMTLLVGANLLKSLKGIGQHLPLIIGITVVRFIALPAIGIGIVKCCVHYGLIHPDPLYEFVLLLQFALPPAVAMSTMCQLFGAGEGFDLGIKEGFASKTLILVTGTLYDQFVGKDIKDFESFHFAILDLFNSVNKTLPGKHYDPPPHNSLETFFREWKTADEKNRKDKFFEFMRKNVNPNKVDKTLMITGIVAPPGAMVAKRTGQVLPQLSFMKSIPDVIFVPTATFVALAVVKFSKINLMRNVPE